MRENRSATRADTINLIDTDDEYDTGEQYPARRRYTAGISSWGAFSSDEELDVTLDLL